ncbi:extracellular solute-binding protein [Rhodobaculum claviforme]|uniref:Iron ABC transporter substrate-binding protein n=1 Tax=Rhodobaculum claviforme TaxID=1549854 RepID=A0A934TNR1_9RHOB|nr:extracellular solute-binding protein [Rhodobaculum claviforme]MBK5928946.1 iron ABC transporter substrate-binding protein [Rhodobaculum claviforme]
MRFAKIATLALATLAATPITAQELTLYSGRGEPLIAPILQAFTAETGIEVNVRYGGTAELAILLQEEGDRSPADLFWAQDAAALGAVADMFQPLPEATLERVPAAYRDTDGRWIATSGRGRVLAWSTERVSEDELPATMAEMVDPKYRGRIALPVTNGSFLAHVAALRVVAGDDAALEWLRGLHANAPVIVRNNTAAIQAIGDGEADFAMTNNYYLVRFQRAAADFPVTQTLFPTEGDIGNLLLVAGMGVLQTSDHSAEAVAFIDFLLSDAAQQFFSGEVAEFPVTGRVIPTRTDGITLDEVVRMAPEVDLNAIGDLEGTLELVREAGLL